jgi:HlyD family secretion protein
VTHILKYVSGVLVFAAIAIGVLAWTKVIDLPAELSAIARGRWAEVLSAKTAKPDTLILQGNVDVRQVNLGFKVPGRIAEMRVEEGDAVVAGAVLATLDKSYFDDDLRLSRARVAAQTAVLARLQNGSRPEEIALAKAIVAEREAALTLAQETLARQAQLSVEGNSPHQRHDEATAAAGQASAALDAAKQTQQLAVIGPRTEDIDAARAQLEIEAASLLQAERRMADADLTAAGPGVILTRAREAGAIENAGETILAESIVKPVWVRTYVSEPDLGKIKPGMAVEVRSDSGGAFFGRVGFISPVAEFTPKSVETKEMRTSLVYRLRVVVDGDPAGLLQGMPVTIIAKLAGNGS